MPDLTQILSTPANEVKEPTQLPVGVYRFNVDKYEINHEGEELKSIVFFCEAVMPVEVDQDLLAAREVVFPVKMRNNFNFGEKNPNSLFYLKEFLKALGLDTEGRQSIGDLLPLSVGRQFDANVTETADKRPGSTKMFSNIGKATPVA